MTIVPESFKTYVTMSCSLATFSWVPAKRSTPSSTHHGTRMKAPAAKDRYWLLNAVSGWRWRRQPASCRVTPAVCCRRFLAKLPFTPDLADQVVSRRPDCDDHGRT